MQTTADTHNSVPEQMVTPEHLRSSTFQKFFHKISHGGYLLFAAAIIAIIWSNISPETYKHFWHLMFTIGVGKFSLSLSLEHWVNDVLMTFFFFTVGLEIKREFLVGALSNTKKAMLPICAAAGGMIVPALIFHMFNQQLPEAKGWGIPMATDIAFSLAVLATLGSRIPFSIRIFLTAFAIADDLGAVVVIAMFYTPEINLTYLAGIIPVMIVLGIMNRLWVRSAIPYLFVGAILWGIVSVSGLHATVAGVIVAMFIPAKGKYDMKIFMHVLENHLHTIRANNMTNSDIMLNRAHLNAVQAIDVACTEVETPLQRLELVHTQWVSLIVLPLFALANTGLVLRGVNISEALLHPISIGVGAGLVFGKSIGVFLATFLAAKLLRLPLFEGFTWLRVLAIGFLGGIGFTMSLFISNLSFVRPEFIEYAKIGIICGSMLSATLGYLILRFDTRMHGSN
ncbi:Na+/H+ antiporter NhaA [Desulfosediminicola flagellatus]|uniref:Na+/H+ antiporter NhaA n=1 Tax=Desulfosediminicola flagellatus TaxID=2569541 RepID=UPI0010AC39D8|nr:Na+/H+ antiporter NhaA [Desulfosediminicola flagellatus]